MQSVEAAGLRRFHGTNTSAEARCTVAAPLRQTQEKHDGVACDQATCHAARSEKSRRSVTGAM